MYPKSEGATFDMDYYKTTHMAIVDETIKPVKWEIDGGLDGPYLAIGHLFFDSMESMGAAMGNGGAAMADVPNFTNAEAALQISEVVA
jgi:uncharacterized protein (TIGR02118 family)